MGERRSDGRIVEAAGGVVWRRGDGGGVEVLVAHRPHYDDWTFPKGKVDPTDTDLGHTAHREVLEETGYRCARGHQLVTITYPLTNGDDKRVTYWEMTVESGEFTPNDEVDAVLWVPVDAAAAQLTFGRDGSVLDAFVAWATATGQM